ncbi:MAG: 3'-5' exoribonuclease [bacterium]|nr:3'-5' exoribonuclease [bacterium]
MHYMIDIETLGTGSRAPIIQIGAVRFGDKGVIKTFTIDVEPPDDSEFSMRTIRWWIQQVKCGVEFPGSRWSDSQVVPLEEALNKGLRKFIKSPQEVWANPPTFDLTILQEAYHRFGLKAPWHYRAQRCCKTLASTCKELGIIVERPRPENHHDAMSDAIAQAYWVIMLKQAFKERVHADER